MMKIAIALGGTDHGRSGLGTYTRALLPRLATRLRLGGGQLFALGTPTELEAYEGQLRDADIHVLPAAFRQPAADALWYLMGAGAAALATRAEVLLLPAANRRLTLRAPLRTVGVVHDLAALRVAGKFDRLRTAYTRRVVVPALRSQTRLVAVSEVTRKDLTAALGPGCPPLRVIPNGVDTDRFYPSDPADDRCERVRSALGLERPYVLYVSRLEHPGKNHLRLVQAFATSGLAPSHTLVLAGPDWGAEATIRAEASRLGLGDRVRLLGHVEEALLPGLVAAADAVVMVGLYEGFGLPVLEALASGRPVLAARAGALPEVVGSLGVLCDPLDAGDIARGLQVVIHDPETRRQAAANGPAWARRHSWDAAADGLLEVCRAARAS